MTWTYLLDQNYTTASTAFYNFKEQAKSSGALVHEASSDGTNVSNTSGNVNDQITSSGEMGNNNAWWVGSQPSIARGHGYPGNRQFIFRRGTSDSSWMFAYVPANTDGTKQAKTANGTTAAVPTYTTTKALLGTLPDTTAQWGTFASSKRYSMAFDGVAPFGWYFLSYTAAGSVALGGHLFADFMVPGSYDPLDIDPCVAWASGANGSAFFSDTDGISGEIAGSPAFYVRRGLTGEAFVNGGMLGYALWVGSGPKEIVPAGIGRSQYGSLFVPTMPIFYGLGGDESGAASGDAAGQPCSIKGESYLFKWRMGGFPLGTLQKRVSAGDRCVIGDLVVRWDGSTQIVVT